MARRILDIGDFANDGTGDSIRVAAIKLNETLAEVYNYFGNGSVLTFGTLTSSTSGNTVLGGDSFRVVGNTGQVSIGTANPTVIFQVSSSSDVTSYTDQVSDVVKIEGNTDQGINISTGDTSNGYIAFSSTSTRAAGALGYNQGLNSLDIFTSNAKRMSIDSNGNVGIGTSSPAKKLHVASSDFVNMIISEGTSTSQFSGGGVALMNGATSNASHVLINTYIRDSDGSDSAFNINQIDNNLAYVNTLVNYDLSSHFWNFFTNGTERMRIDSSGKVGIGTSSPTGKFEVSGSLGSVRINNYGDQLSFTNNGFNYITAPGNSAHLRLNAPGTNGTLSFSANGSERMRITSNGNVGIGTTSPSEKLHIAGGSTTGSLIVSESTSTSQHSGGGIALMNGATSNDSHVLVSTTIRDSDGSDSVFIINQIDGNRGYLKTLVQYDLSDHFWRFLTDNVERMRIDSSGKVGIGTSLPAENFHIHEAGSGSVNLLITNDTTGSSAQDGLRIGIGSVEDALIWNYENTPMLFATNSTERMRITDDGHVLIGTTDATTDLGYGRKLKIAGSGPALVLEETDESQTYALFAASSKFHIRDVTNTNTRMTIDSSGKVGIGTSSPQYRLDVAGTIHSSTGGFRFPDGTTQTTAGLEVPNGRSIAFALIFG